MKDTSKYSDMKYWLIIYDICNEKRLVKVAKVLEEYAVRVQKSVFEIHTTHEIIKRIRHRVNNIIDKEDFVVYFNLCEVDWYRRFKYGPGKNNKPEEERDFYIY